MSYESTGIPLVVRYNSRGEPDGLKEQLDIVVNSISAVEFKGGGLTVTALDSLSSINDVDVSSTLLSNGQVLTWDGTQWVNRNPTGGPGQIYFTTLEDTPNAYEIPGSPSIEPDALVRLDPGNPRITFSQYGESHLTRPITIATRFLNLAQDQILVKSSAAGVDGYTNTDFKFRNLKDVNLTLSQTQADDKKLVILNYLGPNNVQIVDGSLTEEELVTKSSFPTELSKNPINTLSNVDTGATVTPGHVLTYRGGKWVAEAGGNGVVTFQALNDTVGAEVNYYDYEQGFLYLSADSGNTTYKISFTNPDPNNTTSTDPLLSVTDAASVVNTAIGLSVDNVLYKDSNGLTGKEFKLTNLTDVDTGSLPNNQSTILKWNGSDKFVSADANFRLLSDTPETYASQDYKKILTLDGDQFNTPQGVVFSEFRVTDLENFDEVYDNIQAVTPGQVLLRDGASSVSGRDYTFTALNDTPGTLIGNSDKYIKVNGTSLTFSQVTDTNLKTISDVFGNLGSQQVIYKDSVGTITTRDFALSKLKDVSLSLNSDLNQVLAYNVTNQRWEVGRVLGLYSSIAPGGGMEFTFYLASADTSGLGNDTILKSVNGNVVGVSKIHTTQIDTSGLVVNNLLTVGPSGTLTTTSSLLTNIVAVPVEDDIGKLIIINPAADDLTEASALKWDYLSEGLQILGDVSAQNYYGNFSGATAELYNISGVSSIQFATDMPAEYSAVEGEVYYDTDAHTLSIQTGSETTLQVGQEQVIRIRNETGNTINNGAVVFVSGVQGTGVAKLAGALASASASEEVQDIIGIATETIASGHDGFITTFGVVRGIDTSGYTVGDLLYLDTVAGEFTATKPAAPNHPIRLGIVLREHPTEGAIFVHIDPGYDAADLHDVSTSGVQTGDVLVWNGTIFSPSAFDHGLLAGKNDDDHTQYVFKSPTGLSRNTIQPASDVPALTLQAGLSQTEPLFVVRDSLTSSTLTIDSDGNYSSLGDIDIDGVLTAAAKSFLIDHPTKEGMKLQYTCLEGPENGVYCRGRSKTNVIILPDYWVGLVDEDSISVNLTPAGKPQPDLFVSNIVDNKIFLERSSNEPIDCFYTIYATRKDIKPLVVEF